MGADDPERQIVEARTEELRTAARVASQDGREVDAIRRELEHLERRLAALSAERINPGLVDHPRNKRWSINDPGAYARVINEKLDQATESNRASVIERIAALQKRLERAGQEDERPSS